MRLEAKNLSFSYHAAAPGDSAVLNGVTLTVEPGSYWCLAGPNGSGKSTFLKLASGLFPLQMLKAGMRGELLWNGTPLQQWLQGGRRLELARKVAFVPASLHTHFPVSVEEFVLQGRFPWSESWAKPVAADRKIANDAIEKVGIASHSQQLINETSAGETQLALIARALAQTPEVLILDESTSSLDLAYQARIFRLLREVNTTGVTVLVVSHDLNLATEFCPNMVWLHHGRIRAMGPASETLTPALLDDLYHAGEIAEVGKNPLTGKPKIFWK